jgi:hypothetical protein
MSSGSDRETVMAVYDEWEAVNARVAGLSLDTLTHTDLLELQHRREVVVRSLPAVDHQIISRLAAEADPKALGGTSLADVFSTRLRISKQEARRRVKQAELLGPRQALTGEPLTPTLANTAAAQAHGQIGPEHVRIVEQFFDDLPSHIDSQTRDQAEADLARIAEDLGPTQFRAAADRLALLLNQDGEPPHDAERARRRYLTMEKQGVDGMSRIHGLLDPECRATVEAVLAKWAAPGMCNPDDATPCVDGEPGKEAVQGDTRSAGQRNHDALTAMGRSVLASGELGQHNGLPATNHRVDHAAGSAVCSRHGRHRRGHSATDARGHQAGLPRQSLSGDLRQTHPRAALLCPGQALRHPRATHRFARARPRLHPTRLHRPGLLVSSPPR